MLRKKSCIFQLSRKYYHYYDGEKRNERNACLEYDVKAKRSTAEFTTVLNVSIWGVILT